MKSKKRDRYLGGWAGLPLLVALSGCLSGGGTEGSSAPSSASREPALPNRVGEFTDYGRQLEPGDDVLYVNVAQLTPAQAEQVRSAFGGGRTVLLDATTAKPEQASAASRTVGGLGMDSPVLLLRQVAGRPEYRSLEVGQEGEASASAPLPAVNPDTLPSDADSVARSQRAEASLTPALRQAMLATSGVRESLVEGTRTALRAMAAPAPATLAAAPRTTEGEPYRPEYTYTVFATRNNFSCTLHQALDGYSFGSATFDACNGRGNAELAYKVDMIRSVAANGSAGVAEDAKYLRVSILPENGGTGIHLVDKADEWYTWFQSWAHRDTWFGPFANKYSFSINSSDPEVRLVGHAPQQTNPQQDVTEKTGVTVGVGVKGAVGDSGPTGEVSGSFSYTSERMIKKTTYEYTIENNSGTSPNTAAWVWDRKYEQNHCDWLTRRDFGSACYFSGALWDSSWVFKKEAFSAISHKNFVPGYSATFRVAPGKTNTSRFNLNASVEVMGLGGKVIPSVLYLVASEVARTWNTVRFDRTLDVDWSHPYFEPEPNVMLQSLADNSRCLDVYGGNTAAGTSVVGYACHGNRNQLWGLDGKERYRSRVDPDRCLTVDNANALSVRSCGDALNQKWLWDGEKLRSRYADGTGNSYLLALVNGQPKLATAEGNGTRWKPYLSNPK